MRVNNISLIQNRQFSQPFTQQVASSQGGASSSALETSIYNQKGVTIPFGTWAVGANKAEEACIKMFRKVREHRYRKYTEPEIVGFMKELHETPPEYNIQNIVKEFFATYKVCYEEFGAELSHPVPDAKLVKNYLKIAKNFNEDERLGLIGFMQHELCCGATKPLEALANATPGQQWNFVNIMNDILFIHNQEHSERLYDDLRHVIYAAKDSPRLDEAGQREYLSDILAEFRSLRNIEGIEQSVIEIAEDIFYQMRFALNLKYNFML